MSVKVLDVQKNYEEPVAISHIVSNASSPYTPAVIKSAKIMPISYYVWMCQVFPAHPKRPDAAWN